MKSIFKRLDIIQYPKDEVNPDDWNTIQHCIDLKIGSKVIRITQPSSSIMVYALGILTIAAGIFFLLKQNNQLSRFWWGISLLLWGIGAIIAGTSYQAFGYQIKCVGRDQCRWTSWWEVIYMIFQQVTMNAIIVAVAYSSTEGTLRNIIIAYAIVCNVVFTILVFAGGIVPVKRLITFEFMVLFSVPGFLFTIVLNTWRYIQFSAALDLALILTWIFLILVGLSYYLYLKFNITKKLWARKIWFSENDVLHITLIGWITYIWSYVGPLINDLN